MATYESYTPALDTGINLSSTNNVGQTFTAIADHTITSIDIKTGDGGTAKVHITNTSGGLMTTDLLVTGNIAMSAGLFNIPISTCVALTNGVMYGFYLEWVSNLGANFQLQGANVGAYAGGAMYQGNAKPPVTLVGSGGGSDAYFTIYGDAGGCSGGGGLATKKLLMGVGI